MQKRDAIWNQQPVRTPPTVSPDVGSSRMHKVGDPVKASATLSFRFCPPERFEDLVCSFSSRPTSRSFLVTNGLDAGGGLHRRKGKS